MRGDFRGCRYFVMFRPPSLLAPQIVPTAANTPAGQPGLLRPSRTRFVTSPRIGYANRPTTGNWRYGDLHPARLRPCRLLPSPGWDRDRARPAVGEGFPVLLFRLQGGFTVSPWRTFLDAPLKVGSRTGAPV